ncbi:MAG: 23S rRNA (uracil(1939)-C(5))-methyltransferase RlmD, partial [Prevotella sp.]|nr:23S rRNA (uracil(1939)-C(5))-methyltransferase RlmD [Prevotella sp.]
KPLPILENVTITDVAAEGKALARVNDMVVFVPFAVPGDIVDLQVRRKKHHYCEAEVIRYVKQSDLRVTPRCAHFGICGGCKWQNLPYEEQLKAKQKQVFDQLTRIGKIEIPEISPILGSEKVFGYRNKLEFGCCNKRWLTKEEVASGTVFDNMNAIGFHITGAFDKIYPIEKCWLMDDLCNEVRNEIRDYAFANALSFFDIREQRGLLRDVVVRHSRSGEWMVIVQFCIGGDEEQQQAMGLLGHLGNRFPQITSLLYVDNHKGNDTFGDLPVHVFKGEDHIWETMEDLKFKVGPKSFYQTNTDQAYHLYAVARSFAQLTGQELVYDLYTGTGTIANFVASKARKVIGIEYVPEAIEDAKVNSQVNGIGNTLFFAGDMKDILTADFIAQHGRPDVIITDPPRAGMHPDVVKTILLAAPKRIVYVSCNPATQARDVAALDADYKVMAIQPVDMFPQTTHVENVILMERRDEQAKKIL